MTELDVCGCCERPVPSAHVWNRAGLDALAYRVGTHPTFLARLLVWLDVESRDTGLARLRSRSLDDPAIGMLDAFAVGADVLTFYTERIANEGFLRTATERRSLLELARTIGYELGPGVAASTFLAFLTEDRSPSTVLAAASLQGAGEPTLTPPPEAPVAAGTRVQSLPGPGELPQTFETGDAIVARGDWNVLRPRLTEPQALDRDATEVLLDGVATGLEEGDLVVIAEGEPGETIVGDPGVSRVLRLEVDAERARTRVVLQSASTEPVPPAPKPRPTYTPGVLAYDLKLSGTNVLDRVVEHTWSERRLSAMIAVNSWPILQLLDFFKAPPPPQPLPPATAGFYPLSTRASIFGHNAPQFSTLPGELQEAFGGKNWDTTGSTPSRSVTKDAHDNALDPQHVHLDTTYRDVTKDSWAVLVERYLGGAKAYRVAESTDISRADYTISAKVTALTLTQPDGEGEPTGVDAFKVRTTTVHSGRDQLPLAELDLPETIDADTSELELDSAVLGLSAGQPVALTGERADLRGVSVTEIVVLDEVLHAGGHTTLQFRSGLDNPYVRKTVTLNANVARATHGETVEREVLGSGNGTAHQRFALRKWPLTYVSAPTATGSRSTLELRVDGILWDEARSLNDLAPTDEGYVLRRDDDGRPEVVFGDGLHGARVPSGTENVTARYRAGIGSPGLVAAEKLTLLQSRPLGVRSVVNPVAASGAEDPESRDTARANAPLTVLTLDRIVSLSDYEDFTRAFAGIGKAQATALQRGEQSLVHVTVSDVEGKPVEPASDLYTNLVSGIEQARDPGRPFRVDSYQPVFFELAADVLVDPREEPDAVIERVRTTLAERFSFERRDFAQSVSQAEIVTAIMAVRGVTDTDLTALRIVETGTPPPPGPPEPHLVAHRARWSDSPTADRPVDPAQLLMLTLAGATVTRRTPTRTTA